MDTANDPQNWQTQGLTHLTTNISDVPVENAVMQNDDMLTTVWKEQASV